MTEDCELYGHPNVSGDGCPCGRIAILAPPAAQEPEPIAPVDYPTALPPVLAIIRGEAEPRPKAQLRTHLSSLRRPEIWA